MFALQLKESTARHHAALERQLAGRIKNISSPGNYISLLWLMHGYHHPVEKLIAPYAGKIMQEPWTGRAGNAVKDISFFQPGLTYHPQHCEVLPPVNTVADALGVLYVLEGSALGGQFITKMISRQLRMEDTNEGFSFFNPYGEQTMQRWQAFKTILAHPFTEEEKDAIVLSANKTFLTFYEWVAQYEPAINE